LFLIDPVFIFNNATEFITESIWKNGIGGGFIVPIHRIKESLNKSEEATYNITAHDYEYKSRDGKVRLVLKINCDPYFHQDLVNYNGQYWKVCFADRQRNLYGIASGSQVLAIDTDMIAVERIEFGNLPAWTKIQIELSDIDNLISSLPSFIPSQLKNVEVTIQNVTQDTTTDISFQVIDSVCSVNILGLVSADIVLIDSVNGTMSHSTFTEDGLGYYTITSGVQFFTGTITIFNTDFNGTGVYSFSVPDFSPSDFSSDFKIT
jgi:hypothetical protein